MKKILSIIIYAFVYVLAFFLQVWVAIGINIMMFETGVGAITALGAIISLWTSYKIVEWLRSKMLKTNS